MHSCGFKMWVTLGLYSVSHGCNFSQFIDEVSEIHIILKIWEFFNSIFQNFDYYEFMTKDQFIFQKFQFCYY